jgi:hypothetical protein
MPDAGGKSLEVVVDGCFIGGICVGSVIAADSAEGGKNQDESGDTGSTNQFLFPLRVIE